MEDELRQKVEQRIRNLGLKKVYVAERIGLSKVTFSQTLSGKRKLTDMEYTGLKNLLAL
jgi:predicted transcriptional regulator